MRRSVFLSVAWSTLVQALPASSCFDVRQADSFPQYVLDHAPLLWLDTKEQWFPGDLAAQLTNTYPTVNQTPIADPPSPLTLSNLDALNAYGNGGQDVYLHSNEGIAAYKTTPWFRGVQPACDHSTPGTTGSSIIIVSKPNSILDAFYFSFYAFDQGDFVGDDPDQDFGDHVGDWEHTMIRFDTSASPATPQSMWFSQHDSGQAFEFNAVEKDASGNRPIVYIAQGTHANYATAGPHVRVPGILTDYTSQGTLWDPTLNTFTHSFDNATKTFTSFNGQPSAWLNFVGRWGDPQLPDDAEGQEDLAGFRKFMAGPTGPRDKDLGRANVCPSDETCVVRPILTP